MLLPLMFFNVPPHFLSCSCWIRIFRVHDESVLSFSRSKLIDLKIEQVQSIEDVSLPVWLIRLTDISSIQPNSRKLQQIHYRIFFLYQHLLNIKCKLFCQGFLYVPWTILFLVIKMHISQKMEYNGIFVNPGWNQI